MSSMSVVDNIQLVDVNKKTHPQAHSVKNDNGLNASLSSVNSQEIVDLSSQKNNDNMAIYPKLSMNPNIDLELKPVAKSNDFVFSANEINKLENLKHFSSIFVPVYIFFKNLLPHLNISKIFNWNPLKKLANTVKNVSSSIYETGKKIVSDSIDFIKNVGEKTLNFSVELGKNIYSKVTNFFSGGSTTSVPVLKHETHSRLRKRSLDDTNSIPESMISRPFWKGLDKISGPNPTVSTGKKFFNHFKSLKNTLRLDNSFLFEGEHSILQVNGKQISKYSPESMLNDFKRAIPNLESRQLISSYAHQGIFSQPYIELFAEHPNLIKFKPKNSQFSYVVHETKNGEFQFTATSQANLESEYELSDHRKYNAFGVQASMILSKDKSPDIQYSYFLR